MRRTEKGAKRCKGCGEKGTESLCRKCQAILDAGRK